MPKRRIAAPAAATPLGRDVFVAGDVNRIISETNAGQPPDGETTYRPYVWDIGANAETERIVRGSASVLVAQLNDAARTYVLFSRMQQGPTDKQLAGAFEEIEAAANKLLKALGVQGDGDVESMPPHIRHGATYVRRAALKPQADLEARRLNEETQMHSNSGGVSGEQLLHDATLGVARIATWAAAVRTTLGIPKTADKRHGDEAMNTLVASLASSFARVWGVKAGASAGDGDGGPAVRFVRSVLAILRERKVISNLPSAIAICRRLARIRESDRTSLD